MTTRTLTLSEESTPTEDPTSTRAATRPDPEVLAEAWAIARRVAHAELGQRAHEGVDADDVAQEVLLRFAAVDPSDLGNWRAWVTTAARNRARDALRAENRHRHQDLGRFGEEAAGPGPVAALPQQLRALGPSGAVLAAMVWDRATQVLNPREREALGATLDGWSNQEIAERMGYASAASVAVILTRARVKLRAEFPAGPARDLLCGEIRLY